MTDISDDWEPWDDRYEDYDDSPEPDWDAEEYCRWLSLSPFGRFRERASMRLRTWRWHWRDKRSAPPSDEPPPF